MNNPLSLDTPTTAKPAIGIVGGGQIGSRHLQALAHLGRSATVYLCDPNPASLAIAESRFQDVASPGGEVALSLHQDLSALPGFLDVAIVATSADVRLEVLRHLLEKSQVKYLILEKVLFQSAQDCDEAAQLLSGTATRTWVNCPRRLSAIYSELRAALAEVRPGFRPLEVRVTGSAWGIGCNSVHFLDLIRYLAGENGDLALTSSGLSAAFPAKRAGFVEFTGSLAGRVGTGGHFSLTSYPEGNAPVLIHVDSPAVRCVIAEEDGHLAGWRSSASENWQWRPFSSDFPYQSQLSQLIVRSLLDTGTCALPTFEESVRIHKPLLKALNRHHFGGYADNSTRCPIT